MCVVCSGYCVRILLLYYIYIICLNYVAPDVIKNIIKQNQCVESSVC